MRFISVLLASIFVFISASNDTCGVTPQNNCINFQVGSGTGCAWMCQYCQDQLGTNNYYFTDGVCNYETGGCVGNPIAGVTYTCCSN
jgi:hypothetical protein